MSEPETSAADEHRACGPTTASSSLPLGEARAASRGEALEPRANRQQRSSDGHTVAGVRALAIASQPEVPDRANERDAMSAPAQSTPEQTVSELFDAFDRLDMDSAESLFDDEPQGVDELSGGWRRGREALHDYFAQITSAGLADVRSTLADVHTADWGDTAVVTLVLEQLHARGRTARGPCAEHARAAPPERPLARGAGALGSSSRPLVTRRTRRSDDDTRERIGCAALFVAPCDSQRTAGDDARTSSRSERAWSRARDAADEEQASRVSRRRSCNSRARQHCQV